MLNLHHLKYFHDAVLAGSVGESARVNRVSRSAVSQAIRGLEQALGVELLEHGKNRFRATPEGLILAERCGAIFALAARLKDEVLSVRSGYSGPLSCAASHSLAVALLPRFLESFTLDFPGISLNLMTGDAFKVRELLRSRSVELGIAVDDGSFHSFERRVLRKGRFAIVSGSGKRPREDDARFLVGDKGSEVASLRRAYESRRRRPLPVVMEVQSWELIASFSEAGIGLGLVPDFMLGGARRLRQVRLGLPTDSYEICAFYRSKSELSRNGSLLIEKLGEFLREPRA